MTVPTQSVSLFWDLKEVFEGYEYWMKIIEEKKQTGTYEGYEEYETTKDCIRSVCSVIDNHLDNFKFKETSPD